MNTMNTIRCSPYNRSQKSRGGVDIQVYSFFNLGAFYFTKFLLSELQLRNSAERNRKFRVNQYSKAQIISKIKDNSPRGSHIYTPDGGSTNSLILELGTKRSDVTSSTSCLLLLRYPSKTNLGSLHIRSRSF